jgi:hypothetical protein
VSEGPRLIQHWKATHGGRPNYLFLFTDGLAVVPGELPRIQEALRAFKENPTSSPATILGPSSWWFPFASIRRILAHRDSFILTIETREGRASVALELLEDVDYFIELLNEFCKGIAWEVKASGQRFWNDSVRLLLASLMLFSMAFTGYVYTNIHDKEVADISAHSAPVHLLMEGGLNLTKWPAVAVSASPILVLLLLILVCSLMAPRYVLYQPAPNTTG